MINLLTKTLIIYTITSVFSFYLDLNNIENRQSTKFYNKTHLSKLVISNKKNSADISEIDTNKPEQLFFRSSEKKETKSKRNEAINHSNFKLKDNFDNQFEFYKGEYDDYNFLFNGKGKLYDSHSIYEGSFRMSKKHGFGYYFVNSIPSQDIFDCPTFYKGEFGNGLEDGYGYLIKYEKDDMIYREGLFDKGSFKKGKQIRVNKKDLSVEYYEGNLSGYLYQGEGYLVKKYENKDLKSVHNIYKYEYIGTFKFGKEDGLKCKLSLKNQDLRGYEYIGDFKQGLKQGFGEIVYTDESHIKRYKGHFIDDQSCCRYGIVEFQSGDTYEGFFDKHGKNKIGLYSHNLKNLKLIEGDHFFGEYMNDKKHGLGKFILNRYQLLFGKYVDGDKTGNFSFTSQQNEKKKDNKIQIKQIKYFYLFENDEGIDKSDKPFLE